MLSDLSHCKCFRNLDGLFFGVDSDLRLLRIAATNFYVHNIQGYLLHADGLIHETDISSEDGKYNWQFANSWYSNMDKLRPSKYVRDGDVGERQRLNTKKIHGK